MSRYYIYCNNNLVYHALMHNSIVCKALKSDDFGVATASFQSNYAIFVTQEKLPANMIDLGTSNVYYPTILEIDDGCEDSHCESVLCGRMVYKREDSLSLSPEALPLNAYDSASGCVGAFVYGEIPICCLSAILFASSEDMKRFKKSSPDLWFPQDLFGLFDSEATESSLCSEALTEASMEADKLLPPEAASSMLETIVTRDKKKAAAYFMVEATDGWSFDGVKANVDGALIRFLDGDTHSLQEKAEKAAFAIADDTISFQASSIMDTVAAWEDTGDPIQNILLSEIRESLCAQRTCAFVDLELFQSIARDCMDAVPSESRLKVCRYLTDIESTVFLHTELDPEAVLSNMSDMPVLCAFFLFLNQSSEMIFLRNVCRNRPQEMRRYTYMMFGWYHGMVSVDGKAKSNRPLEKRLTEIIISKYPHDMLISRPAGSREFCAATPKTADSAYGITPHFFVWYSCEASRELLLYHATGDQLEHICKILKDPKFPLKSFYKYERPREIPSPNPDMVEPIKVISPEKARGLLKCLNKDFPENFKSWKAYFDGNVVFDSEAFKQVFFSDMKRYQRFYAKHCDEIQDLCREVKR